MRALIQQHAAATRSADSGATPLPSLHLLFGCRSAGGDALYRDEFVTLATGERATPLSALPTAMEVVATGCGAVHVLSTYGVAVSREGDSLLLRDGVEAVLPSPSGPSPSGAPIAADTSPSAGTSSSRRLYVQDLLPHVADAVAAAVADPTSPGGGWVFISGSAKRMPSDVTAAIKRVAMAAGLPGWSSEAEATRSVAALERSKRLVVEAWS